MRMICYTCLMNLNVQTLPCSYEGDMRFGLCAAPAQAKGMVIIMPGWGEWIEKYTEVIQQWHIRGYNVLIAEWRGQGLSSRFLINRQKTWLPSFDLLVEDMERLFRATCLDEKNIILLGHSMGAHLCLRWYLERGRRYASIKRIILASQLHDIKTAPIPRWAATALIYGATWLGFDQAYAIGQKDFDQTRGRFETNPLTHDEAHYNAMMAQLNANPALKVGGMTYGYLYALLKSFTRLEADLARGAPRIPYMVMGPSDDPLVETSGMTRIAAMLPSCETHLLDGAKHELFQEAEPYRNQIWAWVDQFLARI